MRAKARAAAKDVGRLTGFQLCLYDPDPEKSREKPIGRLYADTPRDRRIMQGVLRTYNLLASRDASLTLCVGVRRIEG
jgi:hypothetical protein